MFSQWGISIILIAGVFYLLWRFIGKPIVNKFCPGEEVSVLRKKIEGLEKKKQELDDLEEEVETTSETNKINEKIVKLRKKLSGLEKKS